MGYYGQPIIEGMKGLGQSIRQYGQTQMQTQLGLGQQEVEMAKMKYESRLEQEPPGTPVNLSFLKDKNPEKAEKFLNAYTQITRTNRGGPDGYDILKHDQTPLTEEEFMENDAKKLSYAVGQLISPPPLKATQKELRSWLTNAESYQNWIGQAGGDTSVFPTAFPDVKSVRARLTESGKPYKPKTREEQLKFKADEARATRKPGMSEAELTRMALKGDSEAQSVLDAMQERKIDIAEAGGKAQIAARVSVVDVAGTAKAILDGRETIENVKNTFGVPVQEAVRAEVLSEDPDFNFVRPRIKLASIKSSLTLQQKQRGMMGSFVKNLDKQLLRVDKVMKDVISRVGVRAVDLPLRELKTRFVGSGHEKVLESYLIEISNEIGKLSTGSTASVRELSSEAQARWAKIHDPNLSFNELKKILDETQLMGQMRLESTDEEIEETLNMLGNIRKGRKKPVVKTKKSGSRFRILRVE